MEEIQRSVNDNPVTEKIRYDFIDYCKAVGMYLVILGHLSIPKFMGSFIYSFHMPLFFILSGATINIQKIIRTDFRQYLFNLSKHYLIPYFWCQFVFLPFFFIRESFLMKNDFSLLESLKAILIGNARICQFPANASWFVLTLFLSHVLFFLIVKITSGKQPLILLFTLICSLISYTQRNKDFAWHYTVSFAGLFYLYFGSVLMNWYKKDGKEKLSVLSLLKKSLLVLFFLCTGTLCAFKNHGLSMNQNSFGAEDSIILYYAMSILLCLSLIICMLSLPKFSFLSFIGKNTFFYMVVHCEIIKFLYLIKPSLQENFIASVILSILIFIGISPLCLLVNKFWPYIVGRKSESSTFKTVCKIIIVFWCVLLFFYTGLSIFNIGTVFLWGGVFVFSVLFAFVFVFSTRKLKILWLEE